MSVGVQNAVEHLELFFFCTEDTLFIYYINPLKYATGFFQMNLGFPVAVLQKGNKCFLLLNRTVAMSEQVANISFKYDHFLGLNIK